MTLMKQMSICLEVNLVIRPYRFFFGPGPTVRAGGGEESDGIESSDVSPGSWTFEERVLRVALAGSGWGLALLLA